MAEATRRPVRDADRRRLFVGGRWTDSVDGRRTVIRDPADGAVVGEAQLAGPTDARRAVAEAAAAFPAWAGRPASDRAKVLRAAADHLEVRADVTADTASSEMGALRRYTGGVALPNAVRQLRYYADQVDGDAEPETRQAGSGRSLVHRDPVGVVAAITAWNGPIGSSLMKVAPALAAGCPVVLKPPGETPLAVHALSDAFEAAGLPSGVLSVLPADRSVGADLVANPQVDKVAFTGSTAAGRSIMASCAERIARVTLELGGKSVALMLDDADLPRCVEVWAPAMTFNNGQACFLQSRLLVPRSREREVVDRLSAALAGLKLGSPFDPATDVGPLVSREHRDRVEGYLRLAEREGAEVLGGERPEGLDAGSFLRPALLTGVHKGMRVAREEIFGPVIAVLTYDEVDEAVTIANDSVYGLGGSVWSEDPDRALAVARRIRTGQVSVNGAGHAFDAPFGGFKQSGLGREMGPEALASYQELQAVAVER